MGDTLELMAAAALSGSAGLMVGAIILQVKYAIQDRRLARRLDELWARRDS